MSKTSNAKSQKAAAGAVEPKIEPGIEPRIEIDGEVTRRIRQHARAHLKTEVCGVLIGPGFSDSDLTGAIDIRASIEALAATQAGTHVTFTQDAWEEIYRVKDEQYPDDRIVGWYHSHPGFGVFLSDHDLFIQQNFFSSPGQVAWVYDPHTDEEGCFGWVNGEIRRLSSLQVMDRSGSGVDHSAKQLTSYASPDELEDEMEDDAGPRTTRAAAPRNLTGSLLHWGGILFSHLTVLAIGFLVASFLFPHLLAILVNPLTNEPIVRDGHPAIYDLGQHFVFGSSVIEGSGLPPDAGAPQPPLQFAPPASPLSQPNPASPATPAPSQPPAPPPTPGSHP